MLLLAEIVLTFFAWRKGWKWRSLIPIICAIVGGLTAGVLVAILGGSYISLKIVAFFIDITAILFLIFMVSNAPESNNNELEL